MKNDKLIDSQVGGIKLAFLIFGTVVGFLYYFFMWKPHHDWLLQSGKVESLTNQVLVHHGIQETNLIDQKRIARRLLWTRWVEVERSFETPSSFSVDTFELELKNAFKALPIEVVRESIGKNKSQLTIRENWGFRFQTLLFVVSKPSGELRGALPGQKPRVAIVIDDVSYDLTTSERYQALGIPLTYAILPGSPYSKPLALKAKEIGYGVILHLPMEPHDIKRNNPGSETLRLSMSRDQLHRQFDRNMSFVPGTTGINNHMGSAFTEDPQKMRWVMEWLHERGLFFLDSKTSPKSVATRIAREVGVPVHSNHVFLDNQDDLAYIEKQLDQTIQHAKKYGMTIAIGHYKRKFLAQALQNKIKSFEKNGVEFVTLGALYP